jgi:hypothetical protein
MLPRLPKRLGLLGALAGSLSFVACAGTPDAAIDVGARNLRCPRSEVEVALNRQTRLVREYAVACNFIYTMVHCTASGCRPAPVKPPSVGDVAFFEEDPETLEWRVAEAPSVRPAP